MDEPNIAAFLQDDATVYAIAQDRIYPELIPQRSPGQTEIEVPAVVFTRIGGDRQVMLCQTDSLVQGVYLIVSLASQYDQAVALNRAIRRRMIDYHGPMGDVAVDAVQLQTDPSLDVAPEPGLFRRSETFNIWYRES
jgi:hypothetical protein